MATGGAPASWDSGQSPAFAAERTVFAFPHRPVCEIVSAMAEERKNQAWRGPQHLAGSLSKVLAPLVAKRGFAAADILSAWPEIVGHRYAGCTQPEHLRFERGSADSAGTLTIRVEG